MTAAEQPAGALGDAESEAWDALWETDAARCCSCPSCNYYALDYEAHKAEPCLLQTLIERILAARLAAVPAAVDERAGGETALRAARTEMAAMLDTFPLRGRNTRAWWALSWIDRIVERDYSPATPPTQERPGD